MSVKDHSTPVPTSLRHSKSYMKVLLIITLSVLAIYSNATTLAVNLPPALAKDSDLIELYWTWLQEETGAPENTPLPPIVVQELPSNARMALFYPTRFNRHESIRIIVSTRAIERAKNGERLLVISELAHELVHYILLMQEHDWAFTRHRFELALHGHCDEKFKRLSEHISSIIWQAYHSDNLNRAVAQMVRRACWESGDVPSRPERF